MACCSAKWRRCCVWAGRLSRCRGGASGWRRAGSDDAQMAPWVGHRPVSIRAPVRGATSLLTMDIRQIYVSIRAPVRGATSVQSTALRSNQRFRSAPPCGERHARRGCRPRRSCFDPRPRAGSDAPRGCALRWENGFDPRPRAGSDGSARRAWAVLRVSIRAPVRGATPLRRVRAENGQCFDPRPRAGSDRSPPPLQSADRSFDPRPRAGSDMPVIFAM